jgi:opacity protein-like surface antigen
MNCLVFVKCLNFCIEFRLYAGVHAGNAKYEETDVDLGKFDMSGLAYGVQIGGIYDITKNVELEVGFAYTKYNVDKSFSGTISGIDFNANAELEDSTSMFAGINYKF